MLGAMTFKRTLWAAMGNHEVRALAHTLEFTSDDEETTKLIARTIEVLRIDGSEGTA
jgi:hypothetical protein